MRSKSISRGIVIAATATGLWALGATAAQAAELPSLGGTLGTVTHSAQHTVKHTVKHAVEGGTVKHTVQHTVQGAAQHNIKHAVKGSAKSATRTVAHTTNTVRGTALRGLPTSKTAAKGAADAVRNSAGKAVTHATQEAGKALPTPSALPAGAQLGSAVSRVQASPAAQAAQGLPQELNIGVPEVVPGVPSISILPLSLPAFPITPSIPVI